MHQPPNDPRGAARYILGGFFKGLANEGKTWLRWIGWGASIGFVLGGAGGLYVASGTGLAFGALGGLAVGAVAGLLLYFFLVTGATF